MTVPVKKEGEQTPPATPIEKVVPAAKPESLDDTQPLGDVLRPPVGGEAPAAPAEGKEEEELEAPVGGEEPPAKPAAAKPADDDEPLIPKRRLAVYVKRAKSAEEENAALKSRLAQLEGESGTAPEDKLDSVFTPPAAAPSQPAAAAPAGMPAGFDWGKFSKDPRGAILDVARELVKDGPKGQDAGHVISYLDGVEKVKRYFTSNPEAKRLWKSYGNLDKHVAAIVKEKNFHKYYTPSEAMSMALDIAVSEATNESALRSVSAPAASRSEAERVASVAAAKQNPSIRGAGAIAPLELTADEKEVCARLRVTEAEYLAEKKSMRERGEI